MDSQIMQRTRYILRARFRRVQTCPITLLPSACQHLLDWLCNHPILSAVTQQLTIMPTEAKQQIEKIIAEIPASSGSYDPGFYTAKSTDEHAALCLHIIRGVARTSEMKNGMKSFALCCFGEYLTGNDRLQAEEAIEPIRDVAIDGLYEFLDENLDTRNAIYGILLKYKQRSEWFHRSRLRSVADEGLEGRKGERALAIDLYDYVFEQQVEFIIEPVSSSGEADLVLRDPQGRYLIIDAKYIPAEATRSVIVEKLASGFHQVVRYCEDYNEPEGFLVSFVRSPKRISLDLQESDGLRFLKLGGKTIYHLSIQISDEPSASKVGKADEVIVASQELSLKVE